MDEICSIESIGSIGSIEGIENIENIGSIRNIESIGVIEKNISLKVNNSVAVYPDKTEKSEKKIVKNYIKDLDINSKHKLILYSSNGLINFYKKSTNQKILVSIILEDTCISLRLLDWLITNYSKKYDVCYKLGTTTNDPNEYIKTGQNFKMWKDYKNQLKSYYKKSFDPFCRRQRIYFNLVDYTITALNDSNIKNYESSPSGIITTVGQLNFFRWAIETRVIDYAFENLEKIESDMLLAADNKSKEKKTMKKTERKRLSKNNSSAKSQKLKVIVSFD